MCELVMGDNGPRLAVVLTDQDSVPPAVWTAGGSVYGELTCSDLKQL